MKKLNFDKIANPHLKPSNLYAGGLTRDEVQDKIGDKTLYKLSSNENLLGSSPKALKAIRDNVDKISEYPDRSDNRLRDALSTYYGSKMGADQFVCGNSGSEVIEFISRAFLTEGSEYIVTNPFFKPYEMFSTKFGATAIDVPLDKSYDFALNVKGILDAITDKTRLVFITSPNNPTGTFIPRQTVKELLDGLPDHVVLVYDEVYAKYADHEDYAEAQEFVNQGYNVIGLNSFSKLFGLAGLRVGYAYSTPEIAEYLRRLYKPFILNTLSLEGAIAALSDSEFIEATTSLVQREKYRIYKALDELGVTYWKTTANFFLMEAERPEKELEEQLLMEGIMVRPAGGFGGHGCVRVTIGTEEANTAFIEALKKVL